MIIQINADWRVCSDPLQWIVQRRTVVKGEDKWNAKSFHHTLDHAVMWCAQRRIRAMGGEHPPETLNALCAALDSLRDDIRSALSGFDGRKPGEQS